MACGSVASQAEASVSKKEAFRCWVRSLSLPLLVLVWCKGGTGRALLSAASALLTHPAFGLIYCANHFRQLWAYSVREARPPAPNSTLTPQAILASHELPSEKVQRGRQGDRVGPTLGSSGRHRRPPPLGQELSMAWRRSSGSGKVSVALWQASEQVEF